MTGLNTILHNLLNCPGLVVIGFGLLLTGLFVCAALCAYCACGDGKKPGKRPSDAEEDEVTGDAIPPHAGTPVLF